MDALRNRCTISRAWNPVTGGTSPALVAFDAIWDTGATNSVITQAVVDACALVASGMVLVHSVHGPQEAETYLVNIGLPNNVVFHGVRVTKGNFAGAGILIGMDIITQGDFAVTNRNGTMFSFRVPSQQSIDFVAEATPSSIPLPDAGAGNRAYRRRNMRRK